MRTHGRKHVLILKRREGEKLKIGPDISVIVFDCRQDSARVGIEAPRDVKILREELTDDDRARLGIPANGAGD